MLPIYTIATEENFEELAYLQANRDVQEGVSKGKYSSGLEHFQAVGLKENRKLSFQNSPTLLKLKREKKEKIRPHLRFDLTYSEEDTSFNFLSEALKVEFSIIETTAVSSNNYDPTFLEIINKNELVLDCGAGSRDIYFENVVNFEIAQYPSTDVLGVGEVLPFKDGTFDAVLSSAVLEHVKNPWLCAQEITRVLKPGGELICCVPFLQPLHGYPHHYYNMSAQGLKNLFAQNLEIFDHYVPASTYPIWTLSWILSSWTQGLTPDTAEAFKNMKVRDFLCSPISLLGEKFVSELSVEKNFELASATVLRAKKPLKK